jgi:hypothetical protein
VDSEIVVFIFPFLFEKTICKLSFYTIATTLSSIQEGELSRWVDVANLVFRKVNGSIVVVRMKECLSFPSSPEN